MMDVLRLLREQTEQIIDEAIRAVSRSHLSHYEAGGQDEVRLRLLALFSIVLQCLEQRSALAMTQHAERIAEERFSSGFELYEVQTAFNVLEEAIWKRILSGMEPSKFAEAIGLTSTILGIGKDALARRYVSLAAKAKVTSLDLKSLFAGV
jgi:hypothetical protein